VRNVYIVTREKEMSYSMSTNSKVNQSGFGSSIGQRHSVEDYMNVTKDSTGVNHLHCCVCGEEVTETLKDGSVNSFILYFTWEHDGTIRKMRKILPTCKECYLSHFKCMKFIIEHYKDEFLVESL
jgi:hypothetical protein